MDDISDLTPGVKSVIVVPVFLFAGPCLTFVLIKLFCPGLKPKRAPQASIEQISLDEIDEDGRRSAMSLANSAKQQQYASAPVAPRSKKSMIPPPSIIIAFFSFFADLANLITSFVVWIVGIGQDEAWHSLEVNGEQQVYLILALFVVLFIGIETYVVTYMYHLYGDKDKHCVDFRNFKFWLWIWFFPNMCVVAPNAAMIKVWFHWISVCYTSLYFATHTFTPALYSKLASYILEVPIAFAHLIIMIITFVNLRRVSEITLETHEWEKLTLEVQANFRTPLPRLVDVLVSKKQVGNN